MIIPRGSISEKKAFPPLAVFRGQRVADARRGDGGVPLVQALLPAHGAGAALRGADVGCLGHPPRVLQEW